jgi:hypothetical protein
MNMSEKLWDLANLVTGFAVVQSLAFIFTMAKNEIKMPTLLAHWFAFFGTVLFTVGYSVAIVFCGAEGRHRDLVDHADLWCWVTFGRLLAVIIFALAASGMIYLHWRDEVGK